jgi:hypothetical protein
LLKVQNETSIAPVGFNELRSRESETFQCQKYVDTDPAFYDQYYNAAAELAFTKLMRLEDFTIRHNIRPQEYLVPA